jgi:hypothetical protein
VLTAAQNFKERFKQNVTFIYEKGSTSGTNLTIKTATYKGAGKFYKNEPTYAKVNVDMKTIAFDINDSYASDGKRVDPNCPVPDAFVVRYKTGFQLSSNWLFSPSSTDSIPGVTTVHRFDAFKGAPFVDKTPYTAEQAEPRMIMAKDGYFYKSEAACKANDTKPVALVVYVGNDADDSGQYHGLAMSYRKIEKKQWDTEEDREDLCFGRNTSEDKKTWEKQNNGIRRTIQLVDYHNHPAAKAAWRFDVRDDNEYNAGEENFDPTAFGFSDWFLPTAGQVIMAVRGLGGTAEYDKEVNAWSCELENDLDEELKEVGIKNFDIDCMCWTSTEFNTREAVYFMIYGSKYISISTYSRTSEHDVRPFVAF